MKKRVVILVIALLAMSAVAFSQKVDSTYFRVADDIKTLSEGVLGKKVGEITDKIISVSGVNYAAYVNIQLRESGKYSYILRISGVNEKYEFVVYPKKDGKLSLGCLASGTAQAAQLIRSKTGSQRNGFNTLVSMDGFAFTPDCKTCPEKFLKMAVQIIEKFQILMVQDERNDPVIAPFVPSTYDLIDFPEEEEEEE